MGREAAMTANLAPEERLREELQAELTEVAFQVATRYGVKGPSVDQKLELWDALGRVVRDQDRNPGGPGAGAGGGGGQDTLVAEATDAAYRVALDHGFQGPFLDFELALWNDLRQAAARAAWPHSAR